ncbi:uncharacterized protein taf1c isoform 1-T1 [Acanthopagrus schlegelii]
MNLSKTDTMDYQFPPQLFPSFFNCGPPQSVPKHSIGDWGCYDRVRPQGDPGPLSSWTFTSRHQGRGEKWLHTEPVPVPLLSPKNDYLWPPTPPDPQNFTEHMQNFFMDNCQDSFGCMSEILGENFNLNETAREKCKMDLAHLTEVKTFLNLLKFKICQQTYNCKSLNAYSTLMSDVVHGIPPELLGALLHEELTEQRDCQLFCEGATGGALSFIPFSQSDSSCQSGCLLYAGNQGLDKLNFHMVELQHHRGGSSCVDTSGSDPFCFQLKGPIRQISTASILNDYCVGVRSPYLCGVWRFGERKEPHLLEVVNTREVATCISISPHVLGEVLVVSESGVAKLWTVGRGMQTVREEDHNLYFNAKSSWRWCEFSAHPRVMLYADRTGVELTDIRVDPALCHTLFRISNTSGCRSGERLLLSRYLRNVHSFHHLISTQYSAYIMDERFPSVPMLKCDHMMQSPPIFCDVIPGSVFSGSAEDGAKTTKVLLGSHSSQEITMLQYSGGRAEACFSQGPPQALLRPRDSLKHLPVQIPHRLDTATNRLSSPATGLTSIQEKGGAGADECICILQLTEAGDIFYQILEPEQRDDFGPSAVEDEPLPQQGTKRLSRTTAEQPDSGSQIFASDTSSEEDIIGPTQGPTMERLVPETQVKERELNVFSDASSEDSESAWKGPKRRRVSLQVVVNDPELDPVSGLDIDKKDANVSKNDTDDTEEPSGVGEMSSGLSQLAQVKFSDSTLVTWKHWLQKLTHWSREKKPRPHCLQHFTISTGDLLPLFDDDDDDKARDFTEQEHVQSLRSNLKACMSKRSLLVQRDISASLEAPDVIPVPNPVDTEAWTDQLSHRLTISWQGEEVWREWWQDQLGLNRELKVEALRRKRRREKEAKRASGRRLELSGSFTSSVSYQSELSDFSDSTGWSSAASQGALSENEGVGSQSEGFLEHGTPRASSPSTVQTDIPAPTLTATPQHVKEKQGDQQTRNSSHALSLPQTPKPDSTPTSQRKNKRPPKDYLSSLFATQDEPSQHDSYFLEEGSTTYPLTPPVAPSSSQLRSSQSVPLRTPRVDLSQDTSSLPSFSQSLSQSSQGRLGLSQAKKKKSRMGF